MTGKFSRNQKITLLITFLLLIASIVIRVALGIEDTGILVVLSFINILLYVILIVCALFPADWRMTARQKEKIKDMAQYQSKYRTAFVAAAFFVSFAMDLVVIIIG